MAKSNRKNKEGSKDRAGGGAVGKTLLN